MNDFSMSFDAESLAAIKNLEEYTMLLSSEFQQVALEAGRLLQEAARQNMHWKNPTNALRDSISVLQDSPTQIGIASNLEYAPRREYGFTGMTDSLGRTYSYDPGQFYMTHALEDLRSQIALMLQTALGRFDQIGGH